MPPSISTAPASVFTSNALMPAVPIAPRVVGDLLRRDRLAPGIRGFVGLRGRQRTGSAADRIAGKQQRTGESGDKAKEIHGEGESRRA